MESFASGDLLDDLDVTENFDFSNFNSPSFIGETSTNWEHDQVGENIYIDEGFRPTISYDQTFAEPPQHSLISTLQPPPRHPAFPRSVGGSRLRPTHFQVHPSMPDISIQHTNALNQDFSGAASTQIPSSFSGTGYQSPLYQNDILNQFRNPAVPLRIIDDFFHPFPKALVTALSKELTPQSQAALDYVRQALEPLSDRQRQEESNNEFQDSQVNPAYTGDMLQPRGNHQRQEETNKQLTPSQVPVPDADSPFEIYESRLSQPRLAVPQQTPRSQQSGTSTPSLKPPRNRRQQNIKGFDATKYYTPLLTAPKPWTAYPQGRSPTTFEYTINGELTPERRFTNQEITDYLQYHPGHENNTATSKLRLWIQNSPADSRTRYPTAESSKCRFESCPTKGGTIRTGEFRVCFDEQSWQNTQTLDPYHNAGYVHLYCLEKNFNFHDLYHEFNVQPDDRKHRYEQPNRMAITRDRHSMLDVCEEYKNRDRDSMRVKVWNDMDNLWFESSLTCALTKHHIESIADHTRRIMETRGGFSISNHLGDLQKLAKYREKDPETITATTKKRKTRSGEADVETKAKKAKEGEEGTEGNQGSEGGSEAKAADEV